MSLVPIFVVLYVALCIVTGWTFAGPIYSEVRVLLRAKNPMHQNLDQNTFTRITLMIMGMVLTPIFVPVLFSEGAYDAAVDGLLEAFIS